MTLKPEAGDRLTLRMQSGGQERAIATSSEVKVDVVMQPLPQPRLSERVVLSSHRSFESAEDSAEQWRTKGVEVEIAQPRQWQVWAKRDTYRTPLLRRLLMQNLRSHGSQTAFIDSQLQRQEPKASITVNGTRLQSDEVTIANSLPITVTFNRDDHGTRAYAGSLKLQPNAYGTYSLVNRVPIETYLRGVVPHEIGTGAPPTAIEAQAILARTYALRNLRRFTIDNYQLCATTQCQVYWGLTGIDAGVDRAIANTRGQVLTYQNELVDALYSSTTGGVTAPFSDVWNGNDRPYLRAVVDSTQPLWDLANRPLSDEQNLKAFLAQKTGFNEVGWDLFRWRVVSSMAEITNDLKAYLQSKQHPMANLTQVTDLKVLERSPAGRVQTIAITTDRGVLQLEKDEVLRAFYAPVSTLFYLEPVYEQAAAATPSAQPAAQAAIPKTVQPSTKSKLVAQTRVLKGFAFVGGGFGHGVGMSQTGSYHLGEIGWSSSQILSFYFPGTQLQPLNTSIVYWRDPAQDSVSELPIELPFSKALDLFKQVKQLEVPK
ncbi:SpoIID/LytB domain-containing protein [Phormidium tenue FACHB-886]|nr:SpoIID/LytB domain-containing protein [Phormidium tenue FACHB-886]